MSFLPAFACAVAVALLLVAERRGEWRGVWIWKPLAAASFLWAAWQWGAPESTYGRWILLGLALSACGDVLLIPKSATSFQLGIAAFLCAHLAYAAAFLSTGMKHPEDLLFAVPPIAFMLWRAWRWLVPHLPREFHWPVRCYFAAIGAMGALALWAALAGAAPLSAAFGALGFMASDLSVARERFVSRGFVNSLWGLPLYFGSQLLLA